MSAVVEVENLHKRVPEPPADVQAHNFWVWIGPQFHY